MKKTITAMALIASAASAAHAMPMPRRPGQPLPPPPKYNTICLTQYSNSEDGSPNVGSCDESEKNLSWGRELKANGCAEGQVAIKTLDLVVPACSTAVQL